MMTAGRARVVRAWLVFFSTVSAVVGIYVLVSPDGFFSWPWGNLGMAYNPHLVLDYGAMTLAAAIFLGGVAASMHPSFVRTALASYSVWSVAHFVIHLHYRGHHVTHGSATNIESTLLVVTLGIGAALSIMFLVLAFSRAHVPAHDDEGAEPGGAVGPER